MDITFSSSPKNLLAQGMCVNSTGVGGVAITSAPTSGEGMPSPSSGGAISSAGAASMGATALLAFAVASLLI